MSQKLISLEASVRDLYEQQLDTRANWADWLYENHVFVVGSYAQELCERFDGNPDIAVAASWLHDVADAEVDRFSRDHESRSLVIARDMLKRCGYDRASIDCIVGDILPRHSCEGGNVPQSLDGKIMATADALGHLATDFYVYAAWSMGREGRTLEFFKKWIAPKLERDFHEKILFDEVRSEIQPQYEALKAVFVGSDIIE